MENIEDTVAGADPSAIYALQERFFYSTDHNDSTLEAGTSLKAHLRSASLNINGLIQQKLPIILTYIKKIYFDIKTIQDSWQHDKDSQLIAKLI